MSSFPLHIIYNTLDLSKCSVLKVKMFHWGISLCSLLVLIVPTSSVTITIGILMRYGTDVGHPNRGWYYESLASAITLAIEDYQAKGELTDVTFR